MSPTRAAPRRRILIALVLTGIVAGWVAWWMSWADTTGDRVVLEGLDVGDVLLAGGLLDPLELGEAVPIVVTRAGSEPSAAGPGAGDCGSVVASWEALSPDPAASLRLSAIDGGSSKTADSAGTSVRLGPFMAAARSDAPGLAADTTRPGRAAWACVPPGTFELATSDDSSYAVRGPALVQVRADVETHVALAFAPAGLIAVELLRPDGAPVAGARVRVVGPASFDDDPERLVASDRFASRTIGALTDGLGRARIPGLLDGEPYLVHVRAPDDGRLDLLLEAEPPDTPARRLVLAPAPRVAVRVLDATTGAPIADARVASVNRLQAAQDGLERQGLASALAPHGSPIVTDADGRATITVPPSAWIVVGAAGYGVTSLPLAHALARGTIDVFLEPSSRIAVTVVDARGQPVEDARLRIALLGLDGSIVEGGERRSDAHGRVDLHELSFGRDVPVIGTLRIEAEHDLAGRGCILLPARAFLDGRDVISRHVVLHPPGSLAFRVAFDGWPMPRLLVGASPELDLLASDLRVRLLYLGGPGAREDCCTRQGDVLVSDPAPGAGVRLEQAFDDLVPGIYALQVRSAARRIDFDTPPIEVRAGDVTRVEIARPPDEALLASLTVVGGPIAARPGGAAPTAILCLDEPPLPTVRELGLSPTRTGSVEVARAAFDTDGTARLEGLMPGRFCVVCPVDDPAAPGALAIRRSEPFDLGPGEQIVVRLQP